MAIAYLAPHYGEEERPIQHSLTVTPRTVQSNPIHSLAHFRRYSPVRFFPRVRREPLRPVSASVRPFACPPVALRPLSLLRC